MIYPTLYIYYIAKVRVKYKKEMHSKGAGGICYLKQYTYLWSNQCFWYMEAWYNISWDRLSIKWVTLKKQRRNMKFIAL